MAAEYLAASEAEAEGPGALPETHPMTPPFPTFVMPDHPHEEVKISHFTILLNRVAIEHEREVRKLRAEISRLSSGDSHPSECQATNEVRELLPRFGRQENGHNDSNSLTKIEAKTVVAAGGTEESVKAEGGALERPTPAPLDTPTDAGVTESERQDSSDQLKHAGSTSFKAAGGFKFSSPVSWLTMSRSKSPNAMETLYDMIRSRSEAIEHRRKASATKAVEAWWVRFVHSAAFDLSVGVLIGLNICLLALEVEYRGRAISQDVPLLECQRGVKKVYCGSESQTVEDVLFAMEHAFSAAFLAELLMRLAADGLRGYLHHWQNKMDALIVVIGSLDSWVFPLMSDWTQGNTYLLRFLRFIRLLRLFKVLRVFKAMKAFRSLRVLLGAMRASFGALFWGLVLLFIVDLAGAILMAQFCRPIVEDIDTDPALRYFLFVKFGTCWSSFLTLFELTFVPGSLLQFREYYGELSPLFSMLILSFVLCVTFAAVRIIAAMFLKATFSAHGDDEESLAQLKESDREEFAKMLQAAQFDHAKSGDGKLGREELERIIDIPMMREWLLDVDLEVRETKRLFEALDTNLSGRIYFADFVAALMRMRKTPRSADVVCLLQCCDMVRERLVLLEQRLFMEPIRSLSVGASSAVSLYPVDSLVNKAAEELPPLVAAVDCGTGSSATEFDAKAQSDEPLCTNVRSGQWRL